MQFPLVQIRRRSPSLSLKTLEEWGWVDPVSHEIVESTSFCLIFSFILFLFIYFPFSFDLFEIFLQFIFQFIFLFFMAFFVFVFVCCANFQSWEIQCLKQKLAGNFALRNFAGPIHKGCENSQPCLIFCTPYSLLSHFQTCEFQYRFYPPSP